MRRAPTRRHDLDPARAVILGCQIDRLSMSQTVQRCRDVIASGDVTQHMSINAAKLVSLQKDPELRTIVEQCGIVNADGQAVVWASRLLGDPLPERVAGIDLMQELIALAEREALAIYILGARDDTLELAVQRIRENHPRLDIAGYHHGYFTDDDDERISAEIRAAKPQILFVAMSSPRKEYWLGAHGQTLGVPLLMGVGGSVDVIAGVTRRAPAAWQGLGLEWLFRLAQEPRRMLSRYVRTNAAFVFLVARAWLRARRPRARRAA
jgi:N-acetylglucosaminyldiphosphoundecaprenol N-acetyl-beta-D-mannosaminyltransferase